MPKIEKVLIIVPNTRWFGKRFFHLTAYTPCLLASLIKDYAEIEILDTNLENLNPFQVKERIMQFSPDLVGITCLTMEYAKSAHKLAEIAKSVDKGIIAVLGGIYPTLLPQVAMKSKNIDYVVIGEGEKRFPELLRRLDKEESFEKGFDGIAFRKNGELTIIPIREYIENLNEVPFPDYSKVDTSIYFNIINKGSITNLPKNFPFADTISSRGCPFHCIYCSSQAINGPKIRYRSAENVLSEIDWLVEKYRIKHITFNDDNFFLDKKRVSEIMNGLIERDYGISWKTTNAAVYALDDKILELIKMSGGYQISLAIESGNMHVLKNIIKKPLNLNKVDGIVKKCKELDIQTNGIFMIGLPGETWDQIRQTISYAERLDCDCVSFNIATPLPCTEMLEIAKAKGYLDKSIDYEDLEFCGFGQGTMTTEEFQPFELQVLRSFEWDRINFSSEKKKKVVCEMLGISGEELEQLRRDTRRKLGVGSHFSDKLLTKEDQF